MPFLYFFSLKQLLDLRFIRDVYIWSQGIFGLQMPDSHHLITDLLVVQIGNWYATVKKSFQEKTYVRTGRNVVVA